MSPSNSSKTKTSSTICGRFRFWVRYRLFCKGVLFASGLVFSDKLIEYSILALLITYVLETKLTSTAIVVMAREGVSAILEIVMTRISEVFGRFLVITVSSVFYVIGLVLLYLGLDILGILLQAVGQAGVRPIIREFIVDQYIKHDQSNLDHDITDQYTKHDQANPADIVDQRRSHDQAEPNSHEDKAITRKNVWCRFVWCFSALAAFLTYYYESSGPITLIISMVATGSSLILFLCGKKFYHSEGLTHDSGRRLKPFKVEMESRNREEGRDSTSSSKERKELRKEKLKYIGKMSYMWTTFLLFGLVLSAGKTLFPWQGKDKQKKAKLVRIWIGMLLSIPCFILAWRVEVNWPRNISMFVLVPQFCLLGFMEGLAQDGLDEFMIDLFPKLRKDKLSAINTFVIGLGNLGTSLSFYLSMLFFDYSLYGYFVMLSIVSSLNLCYYSFISIIFYYKSKSTTSETDGLDVNPTKNDGRSQSESADISLNDNTEEEDCHEKSKKSGPDNTGDEEVGLHNQKAGPRKTEDGKEPENPNRSLLDLLLDCF